MSKRNPRLYYILLLLLLGLIPIFLLYGTLEKYEPVESSNTKDEVTEIRFISSWAGADTKAIHLQQVLADFEKKNPGVKIINESMSGTEFLFKLKTNFAQGNDPDVFGLWPGSDIRILINAGKVACLSELLKSDPQWIGSFGEDAWRYDTFDGKIYGLPCEIIYEGLFINRDLFKKYNVSIPRTYEDLKNAVRIFRENGIIPIAYNSTPEGTFIYQNMVMKLGGKQDTENPYKDGKINRCYIDAMKHMKELYDLGAFPRNAFTIDDKERNRLFLDKEAAMIVQGSWFMGQGSLDPNEATVDIIPFPDFPDQESDSSAITYGLGNGNFHMSKQAWDNPRKREICIKLLKYLTSVEAAKLFSSQTAFISNINIPEKDVIPSRLFTEGKILIMQSKELIGPTDSFIDRNLWEEILVSRFPQVLEGKTTPEEVFAQMAKRSR